MNLRGRLLVVITLGGLLPLLVTLWAVGSWMQTQLDDEADDQLLGQARVAARHLDERIGMLLDQARTESRIPLLRQGLAGTASADEIQLLLTRVATKDVVNTVSCGLLGPTGLVIADTQPQNVGVDEQQTSYAILARQSLVPHVCGPTVPPAQQRPFLHLITAITGADGVPLGFLRWRFEPAMLQAVLHQDERRAAADVRLAMIDEHRIVLGGPRELVHRGTRWTRSDTTVADAYGWTTDGEHRYVAVALDSMPWSVIALRSRAEQLKASRSLNLVLGIVALSATALVLAAAAIASQLLTRPIKALARAVSTIDPAHPPAALPVVSGDADLVALGASFSDLLHRVRTLLDERQSRLRDLEHAASALQESETFHRGLFESSPFALAVLDGDRVSDFNARLLRLFGCTHLQLDAQSPLQRLPEWQVDGRASALVVAQTMTEVANGEEREVRWTMVREDGSHFTADLTLAQLNLPRRRVTLLVVRDVSQQLELEMRLRQAQKMDAVGQLAGGVAHDFNNMLAGIIGSADLLRSRIPVDDQSAHRLIGTILTAGDRAAGLARQMLAFSRQSPSVSTPVDVRQIVNDAIELISPSIDRRVTISTSLSASALLVMGDPSQLQNVVLNLCLNARDAMPDGGHLEVTTTVVALEHGFAAHLGFELEAGPYVCLAVIDSGTGMVPEVIARVYEPFFTTKEVGRGTGLGLSVVWGTVKDHHGAITVASQPGSGTTFRIYLPLSDQKCIMAPINDAAPLRGSGRILVVDDEDLVRSTTTLLLEDLGYEVVSACDGQEGLDVFRRASRGLSAVLLDAVMPRMGGRDAFHAMHAIDPTIPIILLSGFTRDVAVRDLREQGLFAFVEKPFRKQDLAEVLAQAVASRSLVG